MMRDEPNPPPNDGRTIVVAVVTAALTSIATGLATWWVDELKAKYGRTQRQSEETKGIE